MIEEKIAINLSVVGHTWHGKSTMVGRYLREIGRVSDREMEKYKKISKEITGDPTHAYSLILHRGREEIEKTSERGFIRSSVMTAHARVEVSDKLITLIDTPGHQQFRKNKIYGMFQSDCALLVLEADEGIKPGTKEALHILRSFEIPIVAVTISKMDEVNYSRKVFETLSEEVESLLDAMYFDTSNISFFPSAALHGEGIRHYSQIKWFDGPTFEDVLKSVDICIEREEQPLRLTVYKDEVYSIPGRGLAIRGTVESGILEKDDVIIFEPVSTVLKQNITTKVRSLELTRARATQGLPIEKAVPRYIIGALLREDPKFELRSRLELYGNVAGSLEDPPRTTTKFEAEITLVDYPTHIIRGHTPVLHVHVDQVAAMLSEIYEKREEDNEWNSQDVKSIKPGEQARVEFNLTDRPVVIEESDKMPWLSKFVIRSGIGIEGFGKCTKIIE